MKIRVLAVLWLFAAQSLQAQAPTLDEYARRFIKRHRIPGAAIAVVRDGRVAHLGGYGIANLELRVPVTDSTLFEIGSMSKQFAAEAAMILVSEGRLSLGDRISKYIPDTPPAWSDITVGHLVTHTSGLADWEARGEFSYRREYTDREFIELLARYPLDFKPGEQFAYTNSGFPLVGMIITAVSGVPYEQFVVERIFKPAGMTQTRFKHPEEITPNRSGGYVEENGQLRNGEPLRPRVIAPNGGIMSSATDMAKWLIALNSGRILPAATVQQMMSKISLANGRPFNAGIGWFVDDFRGHANVVHNGSTVTGFSSVVYYYPAERVGVVALMNIDRWNAVNVLATNAANQFAPGVAISSLREITDPDPAFSAKLVEMLAAVADNRDSEMLAPNLRNPGGAPRTVPARGFKGPVTRFALLEREDHGPAGIDRFGLRVRYTYRYRLVSGDRVIDYTIDVTPEGKVPRFFPEEQ